MSLKRLLNPASDDSNHATSLDRPHPGWVGDEVPIDTKPALQDQAWPNVVNEVLGHGYIPEELIQDDNRDSTELGSLYFAHEQIEQWAAENIALESASTTPTSELVDEQICYGMIYRASVRLKGNMAELDNKLTTGNSVRGHYYEMSILTSVGQSIVIFPDGTVVGELNKQLDNALDAISDQLLQFEVLAPIRATHDTISRATKEKDAIVRVNINVYGARSKASQIGRIFSNHKVYLQRPDCLRTGVPYDNPHVLKLPNIQAEHTAGITQMDVGKQNDLGNAESFKKTIAEVYSSLKRGQTLAGLEGDDRLTTSLLQHQKEALDFMSQREDGPIPDEFLLWKPDVVDGQQCYRHVITKTISRFPQKETGGGILADEMGMGKTLSVLALVIRTLEAGHNWACTNSHTNRDTNDLATNTNGDERSKATLIIASSDLMINEWLQEMDKHFDRGTQNILKMIKYHGQHRETEVAKLRDADIVLTTYHTLAADFASKRNPLDKIQWYRLVLDEAHIIRRQSTGFYRTVAQLKARSRWCLTGTPIQNRLEDIGSLFSFIRLSPFHSLSTFRKYVAIPFDEGEKRRKVAIERFVRLLDSICLRRTKDRLHLPEQNNRLRLIHFSVEEREQYEQTKKMMFRAVRNQVGVFDHKSTLGMFQVQLQLRILCNHGTYQQPFSWNRRKMDLINEREDIENSLGNDAEVTCSACKQTLPMFGTGSHYKRYTEYCRHVLCSECIMDSRPSTQQDILDCEDEHPVECPLCESSLRSSNNSQVSSLHRPMQSERSDNYFREHGRSSKMEALMADIQKDLWSTKSIVFSCWTHTLDLIQHYLGNASIFFRRIDGECPTAKRERILDEFARNPQLRVLIMTTGTGAVGLNLAMANRVFIVEPQWNPSVENQAIARALRLGQEQVVHVTRYVVEKTVEQEMRTLQDRKLEIAGIAWE